MRSSISAMCLVTRRQEYFSLEAFVGEWTFYGLEAAWNIHVALQKICDLSRFHACTFFCNLHILKHEYLHQYIYIQAFRSLPSIYETECTPMFMSSVLNGRLHANQVLSSLVWVWIYDHKYSNTSQGRVWWCSSNFLLRGMIPKNTTVNSSAFTSSSLGYTQCISELTSAQYTCRLIVNALHLSGLQKL